MNIDRDRIQAMYVRAQREIAEVWDAPIVLDLPLEFRDFTNSPQNGAIAYTDYVKGSEPKRIVYNTAVLPDMDWDEIQYGLFHELTHATLPWEVDHGTDFVDRVEYTTGIRAPWIHLRKDADEQNIDNPPTTEDFPGWPNGYHHEDGMTLQGLLSDLMDHFGISEDDFYDDYDHDYNGYGYGD